MNRIIAAIIAVVLSYVGAYAFIDSYTINRDQLPTDAQEMLKEHFPKARVSMIKVDRHLMKKTDYDVRLTNGAKIEFNNKGKWTSVDCGKKALPESLVPKAIARYVNKNYKDSKMVSVRKRNVGYDIGISGDTTLRFNLLGQFKGELSTAQAEAEALEEAQAEAQAADCRDDAPACEDIITDTPASENKE